jgi:ABC-type uncharacterized transport system permease subunit
MTDSPTHRPDQPDQPDRPDRQPLLDLSLPQLVAGATAAATSAILISRLDLLGTVIGAAVASVVSAIVTSGLVGGWHRVRTVPSRFPRNVNGMVVTAVALGLVVVAGRAGFDLVTQDLPRDTFAARWLAEIGVRRG